MSDFVWSSSTADDSTSLRRVFAWLIRHPPVFTLILIVLVSVVIGAI